MASFYGNIKNNSRASFIFDKIYTSRKEMEETLTQEENGIIVGDGVFINRYVLIDYNYAPDSNILYVDRYTQNLEENEIYAAHRDIDAQTYGANYNHTVWMKIYDSGKEHYIMIAELNAVAPTFELLPDAPSEQNGEPHFDLRYSGELNYKYHVPKNWDFVLNEYKTTENYDESSDEYAYYEINESNTANRSYQADKEYPYYNKAGFDPEIKSYDKDIELQGFKLNETESSATYPEEEFITIALTKDTYQPNKYYIEQNGKYIKALDDYSADAIYYMISQKYTNNIVQNIKKLDTKRLDIYLPSIGNSISDVYDSIFGQPGTNVVLGYTSENMKSTYSTTEQEDYNIAICVGEPGEIATHYITKDQFNALYIDKVDSWHNIPVYDPEGTRRPFNKDKLYEYTGIEPYDNIVGEDPISIGWALGIMKKYISELRYLSHGSTDNNNHQHPGIGLQSDWTLDDDNAFGYIYKKPHMLWKDDERTNHTANYVNSDIEWLYDNPTVNADSILDEDNNQASFNCKIITLTENNKNYYLTNAQEQNLKQSFLEYPNIICVQDANTSKIIGYTTTTAITSYKKIEDNEEEFIQCKIVEKADNFLEKYINEEDYNTISNNENNNNNISAVYDQDNYIGQASEDLIQSLPNKEDLIEYNFIETAFTTATYISKKIKDNLSDIIDSTNYYPIKFENDSYKFASSLDFYKNNLIKCNIITTTDEKQEYYISQSQLSQLESQQKLFELNSMNENYNNNFIYPIHLPNEDIKFTNYNNLNTYGLEENLKQTLIIKYEDFEPYYTSTTNIDNIHDGLINLDYNNTYEYVYKVNIPIDTATSEIRYTKESNIMECHKQEELQDIDLLDINNNNYKLKVWYSTTAQNWSSSNVQTYDGYIIPCKDTKDENAPVTKYITYDIYSNTYTNSTSASWVQDSSIYTVVPYYYYDTTTELTTKNIPKDVIDNMLSVTATPHTPPYQDFQFPIFKDTEIIVNNIPSTTAMIYYYATKDQIEADYSTSTAVEWVSVKTYQSENIKSGHICLETSYLNNSTTNTYSTTDCYALWHNNQNKYLNENNFNNKQKPYMYVPSSVTETKIYNTFFYNSSENENDGLISTTATEQQTTQLFTITKVKDNTNTDRDVYTLMGYIDKNNQQNIFDICTEQINIYNFTTSTYYLSDSQIDKIKIGASSNFVAFDQTTANQPVIGKNIIEEDLIDYYSIKTNINIENNIQEYYISQAQKDYEIISNNNSIYTNYPIFDNNNILIGYTKNAIQLDEFYDIPVNIGDITTSTQYLTSQQETTILGDTYSSINNIIAIPVKNNTNIKFSSSNIYNQCYNNLVFIQNINSDIQYLSDDEINNLRDNEDNEFKFSVYYTKNNEDYIKYTNNKNIGYAIKVQIQDEINNDNIITTAILATDYQNLNNSTTSNQLIYNSVNNYFVGFNNNI